MFPGFSEAERRVFGPYDNGAGAFVYADPFRVRRRLAQLLPGETAKQLLEQWHAPAPEYAIPASERFLAAVRDAFEMTPFDPATGQGSTEDAIVAIWDAWQAWQGAVKKKLADSPSTSPSTETASSPAIP